MTKAEVASLKELWKDYKDLPGWRLCDMLERAMFRLEVTTGEWREAFGNEGENSTPGDVLEKNEALLREYRGEGERQKMIWRIGGKVPLNVYENDRPMFQCHTPEDARRIVDLLNRALPCRPPGTPEEMQVTEVHQLGTDEPLPGWWVAELAPLPQGER